MACIITAIITSCKKAPQEKDYLSDKAVFAAVSVYEPILGRNILYKTSFNADGSSYPLNFSLVNMRHFDGSEAPELSKLTAGYEWTGIYDGKETSIAQIEAKRKLVDRPFFEVRAGSGDFIFHQSSSQIIKPYPDNGYLFDVKITNKGNERIIKNLTLRPIKEIPYEPFEYDSYTRLKKTENRTNPNGTIFTVPWINHATLSNLYFTKDSVMNDTLSRVYFKKVGEGSSLTFKFFDKDSVVIDPAKFNLTKWEELIHGFNMIKTATEVRFDAAYPIPLTDLDTKYARSGKARVNIGYTRIGFNAERIDANILVNFGIYEKGDWVIVFKFKRTPRFQNE